MRRPKSLPDSVMTEIQRVIAQKGMKVGDRLPSERELAKRLSVGRSSLREAIQGLQADMVAFRDPARLRALLKNYDLDQDLDEPEDFFDFIDTFGPQKPAAGGNKRRRR